MAEVKGLVADPRRQVKFVLSKVIDLGREQQDLWAHRVAVTTRDPGIRHIQRVFRESWHIPSPHFRCGMVTPAVRRNSDSAQHLKSFDALFSQTGAVENGRALGEGRVREKGLHDVADVSPGGNNADMG